MPNKVTFPGSNGGELAGRLDLPPGEPRAFVLFAHCFTCGKDIAAASRISAGLVARRFAVLRFDFTGIGSSEGEFANTNFSSNVDDLVAAAEMLRTRYRAPRLLVGHSLGGAAVLAAAARIAEVAAVATIGAPADPSHVAGLLDDRARQQIEAHGEAEVELAGRPFTIRRQLLEDLGQQRLIELIGGLGRALLVMHSPVDNLVGIDNARRIYDAARHPKSFISLDGADHLLSDRADAGYAAEILSAWAGRYVDGQREEELRRTTPVEGVVTVETAGTGDFAQLVHAGRHTLRADEPPGIGDDTGPTPYDYLLAGLGACTSMTLHLYARRKGLTLDRVRVDLRHDRVHAEDCAERSPGCMVDRIDRVLTLEGDLSDDDRSRLIGIANRCPVHRTLEGEIRIETSLG